MVATTRASLDTAGLWFTRRTLTNAYPVEAAVADVPKAQRRKNWDWSAWVMLRPIRPNLEKVGLPRTVA